MTNRARGAFAIFVAVVVVVGFAARYWLRDERSANEERGFSARRVELPASARSTDGAAKAMESRPFADVREAPTLTVHVSLDGVAVVGARVIAAVAGAGHEPIEGSTDDAGFAPLAFPAEDIGRRVRIIAFSDEHAPSDAVIEALSEGRNADVAIRFAEGSALVVHVRGPAGDPLPDIGVSIRRFGETWVAGGAAGADGIRRVGQVRELKTDGRGRVRFGGMRPTAMLQVVCKSPTNEYLFPIETARTGATGETDFVVLGQSLWATDVELPGLRDDEAARAGVRWDAGREALGAPLAAGGSGLALKHRPQDLDVPSVYSADDGTPVRRVFFVAAVQARVRQGAGPDGIDFSGVEAIPDESSVLPLRLNVVGMPPESLRCRAVRIGSGRPIPRVRPTAIPRFFGDVELSVDRPAEDLPRQWRARFVRVDGDAIDGCWKVLDRDAAGRYRLRLPAGRWKLERSELPHEVGGIPVKETELTVKAGAVTPILISTDSDLASVTVRMTSTDAVTAGKLTIGRGPNPPFEVLLYPETSEGVVWLKAGHHSLVAAPFGMRMKPFEVDVADSLKSVVVVVPFEVRN